MFKIASLLTLVHVAADSTAAEKWYRDVFGAHVFWRGEHSATRSLAIKLVIAWQVMALTQQGPAPAESVKDAILE